EILLLATSASTTARARLTASRASGLRRTGRRMSGCATSRTASSVRSFPLMCRAFKSSSWFLFSSFSLSLQDHSERIQRCRHHALLYGRIAVHDLAGGVFGFGAENRKPHRIFIGIQGAAYENDYALRVEVLEICEVFGHYGLLQVGRSGTEHVSPHKLQPVEELLHRTFLSYFPTAARNT